MNNIRRLKAEITKSLESGENPDLDLFLKEYSQLTLLNSLISLLAKPELCREAGNLIGQLQSRLALEDLEAAKNMMRRFMWQMNEESGNIAWGVPYAFAYSLVYSEELAKNYAKILFSYIIDLDRDSNFVDFLALRFQCYEAIEIFLLARPEFREKAKPILQNAQKDLEATKELAKIMKNIYAEQSNF